MTVSASATTAVAGPVLGIVAAGASGVGLMVPGQADRRLAATRPNTHVESTIPLARRLLAQAGLAPRDLSAIAVGRGPAPYTGLRISLATARALGHALGVPVWGVSDLDVLAADAVRRLHLSPSATLLVTLDAKRREVYWARYRMRGADAPPGRARSWDGPDAGRSMDWSGGLDALERLDGPAVSAPDLVAEADVVTGPGATAHAAVLRPAPGGPAAVDPVVLARLAALRAARGEDVSPEPLYLRRPDVQAPGPAKRATEARR